MKKSGDKLLVWILIFAIGFLAAVFSQIYPDTKFLFLVVFFISIFYLLMGWYIFRSYFPGGHPLLLLFMGYLYSSVFIASLFGVTGWPLASTFIFLAPVWVACQFILVIKYRKEIPKEGFVQFLIDGVLLLLLSIFLLLAI